LAWGREVLPGLQSLRIFEASDIDCASAPPIALERWLSGR
jgi:hypothetical protein